jgi:hypothetical protein
LIVPNFRLDSEIDSVADVEEEVVGLVFGLALRVPYPCLLPGITMRESQ